jgi:hypothetical protein
MSLSVLGVGLGRTGTLSLKLALEQLGFGPCYHMVEVFKDPAAPAFWSGAAEDRAAADWDRIFQGYRASVDWPAATFWREIAAAYPQAKLVLTLRDEEAWFASTQATIFQTSYENAPDAFHQMLEKVIGRLFDQQIHDKERVLEFYRRHNQTVQQVIPPDRLLVYNVAQGWDPLCRFLGVDAPDAPFPKVNSRDDFARHVTEVASGKLPT